MLLKSGIDLYHIYNHNPQRSQRKWLEGHSLPVRTFILALENYS